MSTLRKQYKYIKPILRFDLEGNLTNRYITSEIYDSEHFTRDCICQACSGIRNTYKDSIWIREEKFTNELLNERLSKINTKKVAVLSFDVNGKFIKRYDRISDVIFDGFNENVSSVCNGKMKTHGSLIWIKESDYTEELLKERLSKVDIRKSKWKGVTIGRFTTDGVLMDNGNISDYIEKGYDDSAIYRVLNGKYKQHKGFNFRAI